ncbi:uncharacterized protein LOC115214795 [Octopus sinensis]|uniref:Uncharacterized protein LOC115214795 n=1 Tax=Octopus sinensis TaxID=2607531 RepID=A0A6P7SP84_9MOLL|nr:uncharacterized protein LOC115214795 [Octopus sinensis]
MSDVESSFEIEEWLQEILGKGDYLYEANNRSLCLLKQLMCINKISKKNDVLRLSDLHDKTMEYRQEMFSYKAATEYLGIVPALLNTSGFSNLKILTTLAQKLFSNQINDNFSDNCYMMALMYLHQKFALLKNDGIASKQSLFDLNSSTSGQIDNEQLIETTDCLRKRMTSSKLEEEMKMSKYFASKNNSYKNRFNQENKKLTETGVKSYLHHGHLEKNSQEVSKLQRLTSTIQTKLSVYEKLPASFNLLNITLAEKQAEKACLEEKLNLLFKQVDISDELK